MPDRYLTPEEFAEFADRYRSCSFKAMRNIYYETLLGYADDIRKMHGEKACHKAVRLINASIDWESRYYKCLRWTYIYRFVPNLIANIAYRICDATFRVMAGYLDKHMNNDGTVFAKIHALDAVKGMHLLKDAAGANWIPEVYKKQRV